MKGVSNIGEENSTEARIMDAARKVFAEKGYHRASVSEIAAESGVGKGTIYQYFENKSDLFAQIIQAVSGGIASRIKAKTEQVDSPLRKLKIIFEAHLELFEANRSLVEIMVNEGLEPTGLRENDIVEQWDSYLGIVEAVFSEGVEAGIFECDRPAGAAQVFVSSTWGLLRSAVIFDRCELVDECSDEFMHIFLEGVLSEKNG